MSETKLQQCPTLIRNPIPVRKAELDALDKKIKKLKADLSDLEPLKKQAGTAAGGMMFVVVINVVLAIMQLIKFSH